MAKHRIRTIGVLIAAMAATAGMVTAPAASADPVPPMPVGTLTWIVNSNSGKCLTIAGGGTADNVYANQYDCDGHAARGTTHGGGGAPGGGADQGACLVRDRVAGRRAAVRAASM
jgi:hypothetical protein